MCFAFLKFRFFYLPFINQCQALLIVIDVSYIEECLKQSRGLVAVSFIEEGPKPSRGCNRDLFDF